ncbi:hypothetical protein L1887_07344 [Cichorium endivia]|nr:hypothetical protein L1887_07344 [Cichorium endivia]
MQGEGQRRLLNSNEVLTGRVSHSIFVTNFPKNCTTRELWGIKRLCRLGGRRAASELYNKGSVGIKRLCRHGGRRAASSVKFVRILSADGFADEDGDNFFISRLEDVNGEEEIEFIEFDLNGEGVWKRSSVIQIDFEDGGVSCDIFRQWKRT